jgi:asparagine synthase (glutamine-hydrolysing)
MCGFAGVVAWDDRYRVSRETLGRMSAAIAHRGPDGEGYHINHEGEATPERPQVALAFRRLAILDPDPRSNQPFTDGRHWLVFNGEIYNFRELREELKSLDPSYEWRTSGDTEVLLRSYAMWGEKCVDRLNGMFAFAVWDEQAGQLFLARDRMGQKPLYVACIDAAGEPCWPGDATPEKESSSSPVAIAFGSELPSLIAMGRLDRTIDEAGLFDYLHFGYVTQTKTIYRAIGQVLPASYVLMRAGSATETPYWKQQDASTLADPVTAPAEIRRRVLEAVRRQLVSDVPLGCFVSGGVDSSVIVAAMTRACVGAGEVQTFSIGFDDPRYDEREFARRVAEHLGTRHHAFVVRPDAAADLPHLAAVFGQPFGDSSALPTHYLARETRRHVKVALSGDGGDELFGGYDRYRAMATARTLRRAVTPLPWKMLAPVFRRFPDGHPKSRAARAKRFLSSVGMSAARRYSTYMRLFDGDTILALLRPETLPGRSWGPTHNDSVYWGFGLPHYHFSGFTRDRIRDDVRAALAIDRLIYLPDDLLTKVDRASMLHALEVRSPFMDHELVQFAAGLTTDQLLKGGPKRMLREAFAADLPDFVFKRKKMGFAVPIGEWFRGELRPMLRDHLFASGSFARKHFNMPVVERLVDEHEQSRVDHSQRLYALLMLELWWRLQTPSSPH